jgi:D-threonate/D-erythronate kinase
MNLRHPIPIIVILADDLTSALDGAAPFVSRGMSACVSLVEEAVPNCDVIALDLDSRFLLADVAREGHHAAAQHARGAVVVFKTIDSTLRGNIGAEIAGALIGSGRERAIIAPAFPAAGRTTEGGRQYLYGKPVEQTAFAEDIRTPVHSSLITDHLNPVSSNNFEVRDATTERDLDQLVAQLTLDANVLWVGSPGLAAALARAISIRSANTVPDALQGARTLVVVGSLHAANAGQIAMLASSGFPVVRMTWSAETGPDVLNDAANVCREFSQNHTVCFVGPSEGAGIDPANVAHSIADVVKQSSQAFDGLVTTGGDTTRRIVDALGGRKIDLAGEIEPGVPFGILKTIGGNRPFATKAGGFGSKTTLLRCVELLTVEREQNK